MFGFRRFLKQYELIKIPQREPWLSGDLDSFTKSEAQDHFEWYVSQYDQRLGFFRHNVANFYNIPLGKLDYSPESLVTLWEKIRREFRSVKIVEDFSFVKDDEQIHLKGMDSKYLSPDSIKLVIDVSFYFARVFIEKYNFIRWEIGSSKYGSPNWPCLTSFKVALVPEHIVSASAYGFLSGKKKKDLLLEIFLIWEEDLVV